MCRMLLASGKLNMDRLIHDFLLMANDQNEKHEKNMTAECKHGDGWGIAFRQNGALKVFKSTRPAYEDDQIEQFRTLATDWVLLHARKASKGAVELKNVHPFALTVDHSPYLFCHNGTIKDDLTFDPRFVPQGNTDSEAFLYYLASPGAKAIDLQSLRTKLAQIKDFTAANFLLSDGKTSYVACWYSCDPVYYTLKMLKNSDFICVASEILPHYRKEKWQRLNNKSILALQGVELSLANE